MWPHRLLYAGLVSLSALAVPVAAQDPAPDKTADIPGLIEKLDAPQFADRQAAQQALTDAGKAAIPALEKAAQSENREVSGRAMDVIERHFKGTEEGLKSAAKESLERLARHESEFVARRASEIIAPPKAPMPQPQPPLPGIRLGGARIQLQVGGVGGGNVKRVTIKDVNGVKEIDAEENGRKVKIVDDPANGIKVGVTESRDGKETTKKYEAKDADELKTKHPEAHKLYDEYSKGPAGVQIQGFQLIPGNAIPPVPGAPGIRNARRMKILRPDEVEAARENVEGALKELESSLETLRKESPQNHELKGALEKAEAAKKRLEELKEKLES